MVLQGASEPEAVRAALDEVFSAEKYVWDVPPNPWRWIADAWKELVGWLARLEASHPGAYYAFVIGLLVLLVAILVHMGFLTWLAFRAAKEAEQEGSEIERETRDAAWHLRMAKEAEQGGRYGESLAHRFAALVYLLDRKKVVRAHPSKTPAEYLREAQLGPAGRDALSGTVRWLYEHLFGGRPLDPELLAEFDRRAEEVMAHGPA